jgi:hypothetical protein
MRRGVKLSSTGSIKSEPKTLTTNEGTNLGSTPVFHNTIIQNSGGDLNQTYNYTEDDWLLVADGSGSQKYTSRKGTMKKAIKWGQMKLFITELQFLNKYWNPSDVPNPICVYVGAATGNHIVFLAKMFPQIEFHLYDGRSFDSRLESVENVKLFVKLFTNDDVKKYKDRNDVFFISDIRSLEYNQDVIQNEETDKKNEDATINDMNLQMSWVVQIKPVKAHLKFRLPYNYDDKYEWSRERKSFQYLDGDIYKQPFAPHTSTEARLVPDLKLAVKDWDFRAYENIMFYHNNVVREHVKFNNPLTGINESISEQMGLMQDFDSIVFITTIKEYLTKFNNNSEGVKEAEISNEQVMKLSKAIIKDVGADVITFVNLRAGLSGTLTSAVKSRMRRTLESSGENENE